MDAILLIDKPRGLTSHDVVGRVRRILGMRRVGHTGTLDPMATGVLPVATGQGTRLVQFIMEGEKTYRATLRLGETTDTQDAEGTVVEQRSTAGVGEEDVKRICRRFIGDIEQIPPMYSALKKDGVPLHRLARQGVVVERAPRRMRIDRLEVLEMDLPFVTIEVDCSKGTYIRTLCHDIGEKLGCGAHLTALRRLRTGSFAEQECVAIDELAECPEPERCPGILSLPQALRDYPAVEVQDEAAQRLLNGISPKIDQVIGAEGLARGAIVSLLRTDRLLAVARFSPRSGREKGGDFKLLRVFNAFS
jgi:tRNA pseudouridine55 synthase